ncbi:MAG: sensor histidine kinase [Chloroflexota bacterium]|nr:sensor histidine kinase [Chloroflexota bacterium]
MQQRSPTGSNRRWTRSLAGQIAILAAVPTAAVLLAVAVLTLFLNQHSRLETLLQAEADRALALATPIERALTDTLRTNLRFTSTTPPNLFLHRTTGARLAQQLDEALRPPATETLQQARAAGALALSNVVQTSNGQSAVVATVPDGSVIRLGVIQVASETAESPWRSLLQDLIPTAPNATLGLVDAAAYVAFHQDLDQAGRSVTSSGEPGDPLFQTASGALLRGPMVGTQRITGFAPLGATGWRLIVERPWTAALEAFSGPGPLVLIPLLGAALLPAALIGLTAVRATRRLRDLALAARRIAAGDFRPIPTAARTGDEIEDLTTQFESMARQLQSLYGSLEQRVADRTRELEIVVRVARSITQTLDAREILRVSAAELPRHPRIQAAWVRLSPTQAEQFGLAATPPPGWVDAAPTDHLESTGGLHSRPAPAGDWVHSLPLTVADEQGALLVRTAAADGDELSNFLLTVAAQIGIALENALLYRQGQARAALDERMRLARDIHDTVAQSLTGVIVHLEALEQTAGDATAASDHRARALDLARVGLREARLSVQGLRASALDGQDLGDALAAVVDRADASGQAAARFSLQGDAAGVPAPIASELLRIGEEALANALRHASPHHVLTSLQVTHNAVRLVIEDDGAGIDPTDTNDSGYGLLGMRERAARLGGTLSVESQPGEGTRVQAHIPLQPAADDP